MGSTASHAIRALLLLSLLALVAGAVVIGIDLRRATFDATQSIRFRGDIRRGFDYGYRAWADGYADLYDRALAYETKTGEHLHFNYGPFRLLAMTGWAALNASDGNGHNNASRWQDDRPFSTPILRLNTAMELAAAALVAALVFVWVRRRAVRRACERAGPCLRETARAAGLALLGAALVWFNPASLVNAHGWPLWDIWIVPFFLAAVLLVSVDRWFWAGVLIAVGAMFKGQQLIVAPWFVLAALFMGRPDAMLRWVAGFACALGVCVSVWMLGVPYDLAEKLPHPDPDRMPLRDPAGARWNWMAIGWVAAAGGLTAAMGLRHWTKRGDRRLFALITTLAAAALLAFVLVLSGGRWWWAATPAVLALAAAVWWCPRRLHGPWIALAVGAALLLCMPLFDASSGWLTIGYQRGTKLFPTLQVAGAHNIPGILTGQFGLHNRRAMDLELFTLSRDTLGPLWPAPALTVTLPLLLKALFFVTLASLAVAAGRHLRARDPRFLAAAVGTWLWMFLLLPQMHERYLLFAALSSAALVALDWRYLLLTALLSLSTALMTLRTMIRASGSWRADSPPGWLEPQTIDGVLDAANRAYPGMAWAVLTAGVLVLLAALRRPHTPINTPEPASQDRPAS